MAKIFNIFGELRAEIQDFDSEGIWIVGKPDSQYERKESRGEKGGYYFSQRETLEAIDLASASKFKKGIWDEEGQRKTYLNIVNFYRDVMKMKININVSSYLFTPTLSAYTWGVWLMDRMFKLWASLHDYDDKIDEFAHDLSTYGSCVSIKAASCSERVSLRTMRVTQTAKSLYSAAAYGGYVIIDGNKHFNEMKEYPDWMVDHLDRRTSYHVYTRFALVPEGLISKWRDLTDVQIARYEMDDEEDMVLAVAVLIPEGVRIEGNEGQGESLIFLEKLDEDTWPLDECHVERVDGRWLGRGEIEKQLENQISRNLNANFRRRGILWGAKKIFQSTDENVQSNLVYEVADGEVIHVKPNGQLSQVNTQNQQSGEIQNDDNAVKENSQQVSFAFEVATGEALPAGTPFRLGVVLSQAVATHFKLTQEIFSRFLKRAFFNEIIPIFKEEHKFAHEAQVALGAPNMEAFREDIVNYHTNLRIFDQIIAGKQPNPDTIKGQVMSELEKNQYAFIAVPDGFYENPQYYMVLNMTDDISADITDLTELYKSMDPADPRRENVLKQIFAIRGKALPAILGPSPKMGGTMPQPGKTDVTPTLPPSGGSQAQPMPIAATPSA